MLATLEGYAAAVLGRLDDEQLTRVAHDLEVLTETVLARSDLRAALSDTAIAPLARGRVLDDLLRDKVSPEVVRLSVYAAQSVPAPDVVRSLDELAHVARERRENGATTFRSLGLLDARRRVGGYADALLGELATDRFSRVGEDLFRWARALEESVALRRVLLDRDAPFARRLALTHDLLAGRVDPVALDLADFCVTGGRPRDLVGTLDYLVNYVARARDWRVARVRSARQLDEVSRATLVDSLSTLTGKSVELHVTDEPELLSGVLVEVGDLRIDATTKGRLSALRDAVAADHALVTLS